MVHRLMTVIDLNAETTNVKSYAPSFFKYQ